MLTLVDGINFFCLRSQVKRRTSNDNNVYGSHVMQYGDIGLSKSNLFVYLGTNPENDNFTFVDDNSLRPPTKAVNQRDADIVHFWDKVIFYSFVKVELLFSLSRKSYLAISGFANFAFPLKIGFTKVRT